jgi:hypothetical protein
MRAAQTPVVPPAAVLGSRRPLETAAAQAGLSEATVDRVLHGRGGVRESVLWSSDGGGVVIVGRRHALA